MSNTLFGTGKHAARDERPDPRTSAPSPSAQAMCQRSVIVAEQATRCGMTGGGRRSLPCLLSEKPACRTKVEMPHDGQRVPGSKGTLLISAEDLADASAPRATDLCAEPR